MKKNIGADLVSNALLGIESKTILVAGEAYFLKPPTIKKIAGAGMALGSFDTDGNTFADVLLMMKDMNKAAEALSWFIKGDASLTKKLSEGTLEEVVNGLAAAIDMLGIQDFLKLSGLSKSVRHLIANPK